MSSRWCLFLCLALALSARAAELSSSATPPVVDGEDIASYDTPNNRDKWWEGTANAFGNPGMTVGQTFTTGNGAVLLKAVTFRVEQATAPSKTYTIRVGEVAGTSFTPIATETAIQTLSTAAGDYWTWTFETPVLLSPNTLHGVDVGLQSSTSAYQTGIPYVYFATPGTYADGSRFRSGTAGHGIGNNTIEQVSGDRIFHLDIDRPQGASLELVAGDPADDTTDALVPPAISATFNQDLVAGSGNLIVRNLTDGIDLPVAVTDARVSLAQNVVLLETPGLVEWGKSYAILMEPGAVEGDGGEAFSGIADNSTWNFSTAVGDPLLLAIEALTGHVDGSGTLSGSEIATYLAEIKSGRQRLDDSETLVTSLFNLVTTYDDEVGAIFAAGSPAGEFSRNITDPGDIRSVSDENIHWAVYTVMQLIMDEVYRARTIAAHGDLLDGFKFGSSAHFPGAVDPPDDPEKVHVARIHGSFRESFGRPTQQWELPARKPTGCYLAPGTIVTVEVPPELVDQGYLVRVGAHSWDLSGRPPVKRLERASLVYPLDAAKIEVASPYGGGIYLEVPQGADAGVVDVRITGAVRSPYFSLKSFHTTTDAEWTAGERDQPGPWADFQTEKFMMQVPSSWIRALDDPTTLMVNWDHAMDAMNDLMGFPRLRGKETMYPQVDVILRSAVHAPGYPSVNKTYNPDTHYDGLHGGHLVFGPQTGWSTEYHEQGHAYRFPKFGGETESNVNLLHVAVWHRKFGYSLDDAFRGSVSYGNFNNVTDAPLDNTAVLWMTSFNFSPRDTEMADWEKAYQPQGHAKFVDVVRLFGWEGLDAFWYSMNLDEVNGDPVPGSDDAKLLRLCRSAGEDLRPLFHFWGIHPSDPAGLAAAIEAEGFPPSAKIHRLLRHYQSLVPEDLGAYRDWCLDWYGKQPSINGNGVEREHARQWDTTDHFTANGWAPMRPDGEIYSRAAAAEIGGRVEEILGLYFGDYTAWAAGFAEADIDDPAADFDGDGLDNDHERIFGLDPTDASSSDPIAVPLDRDGRFSFTRRDPALTGLGYEIWTSQDLMVWHRDDGAVQSADGPDARGVESVAVELSPSQRGRDRLFVQVRVVE